MVSIEHGVTCAIGIIGVLLAAIAHEVTAAEIGVITFVQGSVTLTHPQAPAAAARFRDDVRFHDIIETQKDSRAKALFQDDSILTVGEHSRIEITEYVFNPHESTRSVIINLVGGKLRALVGKVFAEAGSRFEIHTPTAVAAARGTYFIVWLNDRGRTGVANIGEHGRVDFTSHGVTVMLQSGEFSEERDDGPTLPVPFRMKGSDVFAEGPADVNTLVFLQQTIVDTDVRESLRVEIHGDSISSGDVGRPLGLLTSPSSLPGGGALTPPAVISGAAGPTGAGGVFGGGNLSGIGASGNIPGGGGMSPPASPPIVTGPIVIPPPGGGGKSGPP
jgi:FecR protein